MQAQADATLELLLETGVNHIDTAPRYGDSELRIGPWMREHRKRYFLATKTQSLGSGLVFGLFLRARWDR
jgi:aryl-alcohol dehydrogenase-like predicted oxidoreductase